MVVRQSIFTVQFWSRWFTLLSELVLENLRVPIRTLVWTFSRGRLASADVWFDKVDNTSGLSFWHLKALNGFWYSLSSLLFGT